MSHPVIPQVLSLATPIAEQLGLELVGAVFHTNQNPPVLRVDIRNLERDTGLDDCERMSQALEPALDEADLLPGAYVLEVSSPGASRTLSSDREFTAFKGFAVLVSTHDPLEGSKEWSGQLIKRDETAVYINQKGRTVVLPRDAVAKVQLQDPR
ncbi:ribosome maturation factor RimP [Leptolyngbya sp. FACHB-261]|uniref:ribosome maturation factor RimP n=1 Tax=Leptolyngbya sp. FACHB-261 TaxID=2692806 RepID=UPI0016831A9E|nr:ribosome maturation factor RimP [Leptolyngbya sp. FACHB-261]MBD2100512.1 ribosome maturation factor RimP [Leptolyngbya sp. FACHB-261]